MLVDVLLTRFSKVNGYDCDPGFLAPQPDQNFPQRRDNLACPDEPQIKVTSDFSSHSVSCSGEDPILETPSDHSVGAIWKNQIGRMKNQLRPVDCKRSGRFRIDPIETDHHPHSSEWKLKNGKARVPGREKERFPVK